jgi:hypothetical protein
LSDPLSNVERKYFYGHDKNGYPVHLIVHPIYCEPVKPRSWSGVVKV